MEWCRLYARLRHDVEVQNLNDAQFRLFVESLCYATEAETDGHVPRVQLPKFGRPGSARNAAALVAAELWTDVGDGWVITKWHHLQEDLETVRKRRKKDADRKAEARAAKAAANGHVRGGLPPGLHSGLLQGVPPVEEIREEDPPNPPSPRGGSRCTKHRRPKDYCADCHLPPLTPVPPWCGQCESDEYRWVQTDDGRSAHCPRCHPSTVRAVTA